MALLLKNGGYGHSIPLAVVTADGLMSAVVTLCINDVPPAFLPASTTEASNGTIRFSEWLQRFFESTAGTCIRECYCPACYGI